MSRTPPCPLPASLTVTWGWAVWGIQPVPMNKGSLPPGSGVCTRAEEVERALLSQWLGPAKGRLQAQWQDSWGGYQDSVFSVAAPGWDGKLLSFLQKMPAPVFRFPPHPIHPAPGSQLHWVPWLDGEARDRKGRGSPAESSKHRELKRTVKTAAGTVHGLSAAENSTGLVQRQGQDRRELLRSCTPTTSYNTP